MSQPSAQQRRAFLDERRASSQHRYTTLYSATYDAEWGEISPTHERFVRAFIALVPGGGAVLDAACGTGKYWPMLLAAGLDVTGVDQSEGMLAQAIAKHPGVGTRVLALQDLARQDDLHGRFDGLVCVDALENVGPEDWPVVLRGFAAVLAAGAPAYVSVELPEGTPPTPPIDPRQVPGEEFDGVGYHYYPQRAAVRGWLAQDGFDVVEEADGDWYWHLLLRRSQGGSRSVVQSRISSSNIPYGHPPEG